MNAHNILYYTWNENTYSDCVEALKNLGLHVVTSTAPRTVYDFDEPFMEAISTQVKENAIDTIFSFNYFPDLSRIAQSLQIAYVSWCYDSPHLVLESVTLNNACNRVYLFDYGLYERLVKEGITTVNYLPLACNVARVSRVIEANRLANPNASRYRHELSFLGNMYDNEYNFYDQIQAFNPYIKGYLDALMSAQTLVYGLDMIHDLLDESLCKKIYKLVKIDMGENYRECRREVLISMIQKKITVNERRNLLTVLGSNYPLDHYADREAKNLPVHYCGYADYCTEMPIIFHTSKINLNISLRSIQTGIPLRVIDILGAGGFCLTNYQAELGEYFENGKSIVWFESYDDLFDKIAYYLEHEDEREAIAAAGHRIIAEEFTYEKLLGRIFAD